MVGLQEKQKNRLDLLQKKNNIIAIASSKGGVGKTLVAANIAYHLTKLNKTVTIIDLNLASPGLHALFGINSPAKCINSLFIDSSTKLTEVVVATKIKNLNVICDSHHSLGKLEKADLFVDKLLSAVKLLKSDYVIFDLGTGLSKFDTKLFLSAQTALMIGTPEPTAVKDNFSFLKLCVLHRLEEIYRRDVAALQVIHEAQLSYNSALNDNIKNLIKNIMPDTNPRYDNDKLNFFPKYILNMVRDDSDLLYAQAINSAVNERLRLKLQQVGFIPFCRQLRALLKKSSIEDVLKNANGAKNFYENLANELVADSWVATKYNAPIKIKKLTKVDRDLYQDDQHLICTSSCARWGDCSYQHGGYPCKIKYIGFMNTN